MPDAANDAHSAVQAYHAMNARLTFSALSTVDAADYTFAWNSVEAPSRRVRNIQATSWMCESCGVTLAADMKNDHLVGPDHLAQVCSWNEAFNHLLLNTG